MFSVDSKSLTPKLCTRQNTERNTNKSSPNLVPPNVTVVTSSPEPLVEDTDSVILTCTADANPPPTYLWVRKAGAGGEVGRGPVLTISPVDRGDIDTYSCIASNSIGSSAPRAVNVDVHCKGILDYETNIDSFCVLPLLLHSNLLLFSCAKCDNKRNRNHPG